MEIDALTSAQSGSILATAYGPPAQIVNRAAALVETTARKEK
jgi:hypothetical protein